VWLAAALVVMIIIASIGVAYATGYGRPPAPIPPPVPSCSAPPEISGTGPASLEPLFAEWGHAWFGLNNETFRGCLGLSFQNASNGSGAENDLLTRSSEYASTESVTSSTFSGAASASLVAVPVAAQALAVVYHLPGTLGPLDLGPSELAGMFLGTVQTWNASPLLATNPGLAQESTPVIPVHLAGSDAANLELSQYLTEGNATWSTSVGATESPSWPAGVGVAAANVTSLLQTVESTPGAIGYVFLPAPIGSLSEARLLNPAGSFEAPLPIGIAEALASFPGPYPTASGSWANTSLVDAPGGSAYPLTTLVYVLVHLDLGAPTGGALAFTPAYWLAHFLYWTITAESTISGSSYAPIPAPIIDVDIQIFEKLKWQGTTILGDPDSDND
jgi:phosphate transport system substrate-binding protein